ncbi:MAG: hypothetical protein VB090_00975, partial [Petrimonas sp.]|nr:hypothetical protein [Petrimonas sp.]
MERINFKMLKLSALILGIMLSFPLFSQTESMGEMFELAKLKPGMKNRRISSTDPTGGNRDHLEPF